MSDEFFKELRGDSPAHKPLAGQRGVRYLRQVHTASFSLGEAFATASLLITLAVSDTSGHGLPVTASGQASHVWEPGTLTWVDDESSFDAALAAMDELLDSIHEVAIPPDIERMAETALLDLRSRSAEPDAVWADRLAAQVVKDA